MKVRMAVLTFWLALLISTPAVAAGMQEQDPPRSLGLALGSGGAGGLAHIAMLQVFDDLEMRPDHIAGTSIGALIGALYASGLSAEEIRDIFDDFTGSNLDLLSGLMRLSADFTVRDLFRLDFGEGGFIDSGGLLEFLASKVEARTFDDLVTPLDLVATDYWTGDTVVLNEGDLFEAIEASMAVPGLFSPVRHGDQLLIDGGTSNPLPFDSLEGLYDLVVAIDVSGARRPDETGKARLTDLLSNTFEIMQQSIITSRMRISEPDIYIKPDTSDFRLLHFHRLEDILKQAEPAAEELRLALEQPDSATVNAN